jgi:steroid delta-isomerase-like uncharacterized protein
MNDKEAGTMTTDKPDSLIRRILDMAFNQGNYAIVEELLTPDSVTHTPTWGMPNNRMGFKQLVASIRAGFPDLHCIVEDEIGEVNKFAAHWTMRGTHRGTFLGNPPTGRKIEAKGFIFARITGGRVVENWILIDQLGMLQQLGVAPPSKWT